MGQQWNKFRLLMWKNWVLQYRRPIQTIVEVVAPILFSMILVVLRSLVDPVAHDEVVYQPFYTIPNYSGFALAKASSVSNVTSFSIIYTPNNTRTQRIMSLFGNYITVEGFDSPASMQAYYMGPGGNNILAGIQFDDLDNDDVKFTLRFPGELRTGLFELTNWQTNLIFPIYQTTGPRDWYNRTGAAPNYYGEGFLALQHIVSTMITLDKLNIDIPTTNDPSDWMNLLNESRIPLVKMRRFPYAQWQEDILLTTLKSFVSLIVLLSFVYTCINTVKSITTEKEKQLKEAMKIMGLPNWLHWCAWFLKTFSYLMVSIILMVVLLKVRWYRYTNFTVFTYANPYVLLLFLIFYVCATITFCFAVSVFFSKANTAATIAGLIWFLSYAPYTLMQNSYDTLSLSAKLLASLGSNTAMAFGFQLILMFESNGEGVQFDNIWTPNTPDDGLTLGHIMVLLTIDTFIYLLVALYVEAIFPGDYGVPQKWYFPFTSDFWCGRPKTVAVENLEDDAPNHGEFFEVEPKNMRAGVRIKNLTKVFGTNAAVRNLSLNMYENHITVLLGHNGAGKTTTMSMLTGMFTPTSGTATVGGCDIRTNMEGVRDSLGLCPQHNIIFDDLTVAEHLYFFSRLKGMNGADIDKEISKYVELLELQPKRKSKASTLSGGMKRKLCVGVALCGNSKVVMLDEPTSGMDPSARRALWDLMLNQKTGRTVLLTTHFMDEADLLGDRIAIMAGGELRCCGSSFFLKKKYGAGYHLIMDKSPQCNPENVTNLLRNHIPNIEVHSSVGSELTYLLAESQSYIFEPMLHDLEMSNQSLGINSYGISLTTLEEVFMKVGADHAYEEQLNGKPNLEINGYDVPVENKSELKSTTVTSIEMIGNQFKAMTLKKVLSMWRSWVLMLVQIIMPVSFLAIVMAVVKQQNSTGNLPAMPMTMSKYDNPILLADGNLSSPYVEAYKKMVGGAFQEVSSIQETILRLTAETPATVRRTYVGGISVSNLDNALFDGEITTYFNNDPYHTPALTLGLVLSAIYRQKRHNGSIQVTNYPMPYKADTKVNQLLTANSLGFQLGFNVCFSMAFVSSFYIIFVVRERASKSKHLQFVSGVKVPIFWLTTFFWDFLTYLITVAALLITFVCFQEDGFKTAADIGRMLLILLYFGWAALPMMYIAGFFFDVPSTGYTRMTLFSIFTGCAAFLVIQLMVTPGLNLEPMGKFLHWVFLLVPHYSLAAGIRDVFTLYSYNKLCNMFYDYCRTINPDYTNAACLQNASDAIKQYCEGLDENYYKWEEPGIGRNLVFSFSTGFVMLVVLLLVEYNVFSTIVYVIGQKFWKKRPVSDPDEDDDVRAEKRHINETPLIDLQANYTIVVKDLTKYYKNFLAVNGLCLGVRTYECFGLLGINGAGKTTTFKMLTGDVKISYGDAWVNGHNIKKERQQVQKWIGYCPQFDALLDDMTARESIWMFALLRGIRSDQCNQLAEKLASNFDFLTHLDKKVKELSGGNKRKLSTSIALIGDPPVIYLDEPTTGMDPATKRYLWDALCCVRDSGKTLVLTSHSMEECEALCTRLAIMVNGNFKCLGSTQHLKNKFAEGYTITIKVRKNAATEPTSTEEIERFISENFLGAVLRERHDELLTFYVTNKTVPWSKMFGTLEAAKKRDLNIEDYSLGQSSLEQVFLTFTKQQNQI